MVFAGNCTVCHSGFERDARAKEKFPSQTSTTQNPENIMSESLRFLGSLEGHKGWVTAIATSSENPDMILTASRGTLKMPLCYHPNLR
jgi:hypothetical protein